MTTRRIIEPLPADGAPHMAPNGAVFYVTTSHGPVVDFLTDAPASDYQAALYVCEQADNGTFTVTTPCPTLVVKHNFAGWPDPQYVAPPGP
jgi:hypothetical protein